MKHYIENWPDYDRNKNVGLPTKFIVITFSSLIAWIAVANYWDLICEVVSKMF
jgi:hypothetical protein